MSHLTKSKLKILMVCLGNICRSPTAEVVLRTQIQTAGLADSINVDSAGTSFWHQGQAPDSRSIFAGTTRLYDLTPLRARQVVMADFSEFDHILAMDTQNFNDLQALCPLEYQHKLQLLLDYGNTGWSEVPDPYNGGKDGFELVLDLIESACSDLLTSLINVHKLQRL